MDASDRNPDELVRLGDVLDALREYDEDLVDGCDWFDAVGEHPADTVLRLVPRAA